MSFKGNKKNHTLFFPQVLFLSFALLYSNLALSSSGITYHGRLLNPDGTGVTSSSVQFKMQIRTPGTEDCLMYEEIQTIDMSAANGMFALSLGDGTGTRTDSYSGSWNLFATLSNRKSFTFAGADCTGASTYNPSASDNRKFRVYFNDGTFAGWEALPLQTINFIPMSIESYAVGGFPASSLLRVEDAGTLGTPSALTTAQYNEIVALVGGTSSLYTKAGQLNGSALPSLTAGQTITSDGSGGWNATTPLTSESDPNVSAFAKASLPTCASGEVLKADGTSLSCVTDTSGGTPSDATDSTKGIASFPSAGGLSVSSGAVSIPDQGSVTPGSYAKVTVNQKGLVTAHGTLAESDIPQLTSSGNGVSGGAITSGTIGGSTAINTSGNIATSGAISSGTFSTRQIDLYDSDNTNYIRLVTPATGDLTSNYSIMLPTSLGSANQVLGMNSAGTALENKSVTAGSGVTITHGAGSIQIAATGSGGTVTSVSGTSPISVATGTSTPVISLDNSGVTAATYGSATQVPVFAVDAKGRVTSVTNTTITGVSPVGSSLTQYQVWVGDGSNQAAAGYFGAGNLRNALGNAQIPGACTSAQTLVWSAITDVFSCTNISITSSQVSDIATNYFKQDGNSYGAAATLGTNDTYALNFETDGSTRMMIDTSGNVGIGTSSPDASALLDVFSTTKGFLPPRMTTAQRTAIASPAEGLIVYDTSEKTAYIYRDSSWKKMADITEVAFYVSKTSTQAFTNTWTTIDWETEVLDNAGAFDTATDKFQPSVAGYYLISAGAYYYNLASGHRGHLAIYKNGVAITSNFETEAGDGRAIPTVSALVYLNGSTDYVDIEGYAYTAGDLYNSNSTYAHGFLVSGGTGSGSGAADNMGNHTASQNLVLSNYWLSGDGGNEGLKIDSNGVVGIGTASPDSTSLLDITSTTKGLLIPRMTTTQRDAISSPATGLQVYNTTTNALNYYNGSGWQAVGASGSVVADSVSASSGTAGSPSISFSSDTNTGFYSSGADAIGISAGGSNIFNLSSSGLVSATTGGGLVTTADGTAAAPTFSFAGDADTGWFRPAADTLAASTGGSERVRIDSSGNMGIGTTSPATKLHITGTEDTIFDATNVSGQATGLGTQMRIENYSTTTDSFAGITLINRSGSVGIARIAAINKGANATDMAFVTESTTPSEKLRITGAGYVGIGTDAPVSLFQINSADAVASTSGSESLLRISNSSTADNRSTLRLQKADASSGNHFADIRLNNAGTMELAVGTTSGVLATSAMVIDASRNVGIGTTNPVTPLTVNGNIGTYGAASGHVFYKANGTTPGFSLGRSAASDDAQNLFIYNADNSTYPLFIDSSSYVGMGATSPNSPLEVAFDSSATGLTGYATIRATNKNTTLGNTSGILFDLTRTTPGQFSAGAITTRGTVDSATADMLFYTRDGSLGERMRITSTGNVGIGTTNPTEKFQWQSGWLYTPYTATQTDGIKMGLGNTTGYIWRNYAGGTGHGAGYISDALVLSNNWTLDDAGADVIPSSSNRTSAILLQKTNIHFSTGDVNTAPSAKMTILSGGNVGIGTTNPSVKFHIVGGSDLSLASGGYIIMGSTSASNMVLDDNEIQTRSNGANSSLYINRSGGNVYMGNTGGASSNLYVYGTSTTCTIGSGSGATNCTSDERLKDNITPIENPIDKVLALSGVEFDWNEKAASPGKHSIGVIAQDVEKVFPTAVVTDEKTTYKMVDYAVLVAPLIEAVKELWRSITNHDERLAQLEKENQELRQRLERLEEKLK